MALLDNFDEVNSTSLLVTMYSEKEDKFRIYFTLRKNDIKPFFASNECSYFGFDIPRNHFN